MKVLVEEAENINTERERESEGEGKNFEVSERRKERTGVLCNISVN